MKPNSFKVSNSYFALSTYFLSDLLIFKVLNPFSAKAFKNS